MISQNFLLSFPMSFCSGILIIRYILSTLTSFDFYLLTFVIIINYFYLNHFFIHFSVTGYVIKFWEFIGVFTTNSVCYCYFYFVIVMIFLQFSGKVHLRLLLHFWFCFQGKRESKSSCATRYFNNIQCISSRYCQSNLLLQYLFVKFYSVVL